MLNVDFFKYQIHACLVLNQKDFSQSQFKNRECWVGLGGGTKMHYIKYSLYAQYIVFEYQIVSFMCTSFGTSLISSALLFGCAKVNV